MAAAAITQDDTAPLAVPKAPGEVRSIQYLRGLAAFGVLAFHAADRAGYAFTTGAAGVDVFFVISGFIMWVTTCRKGPTPQAFMLKRIERIAPLYWGLTLGVAATAILIPGSFPALKPTFGHLARSLLFVPHRDDAGLIAPLIVPGWTLNYEMFFYLVFAGFLLAPARIRVWGLSAVLAGLALVRPLGPGADPLWATYTNPLLLEFAAGVWLGRMWSERRLPARPLGWALIAAGLAGFTATAVTGADVDAWRVLTWGLPALALVAGAVTLERNGPVPALPAARALGDASYSLYLVHGLAISAVARLLQAAHLGSPLLLFALSIAAGVAAGLAAYRLAEQPLMRLFRTGMASRRPSSSEARRAGGGASEGAGAAPAG